MKPFKKFLIYLTNQCNLSCTYCSESKHIKPDSINMNLSNFKKRIREIIEDNINNDSPLKIILYGGEPLLEFDLIKEIVNWWQKVPQYLKQYVEFSIPTNGTLLDYEKLEFLINNNIEISLSWDGNNNKYRKYKNNTICNLNLHDIFTNIVKINKQYKLMIGYVVTDKNQYTIENDMQYLIKNGFNKNILRVNLMSCWDAWFQYRSDFIKYKKDIKIKYKNDIFICINDCINCQECIIPNNHTNIEKYIYN